MEVNKGRFSLLKPVTLNNEECPFCETNGSITLNNYSTYSTIYGIPFYPKEKVGEGECENCGREIELEVKENYSYSAMKVVNVSIDSVFCLFKHVSGRIYT